MILRNAFHRELRKRHEGRGGRGNWFDADGSTTGAGRTFGVRRSGPATGVGPSRHQARWWPSSTLASGGFSWPGGTRRPLGQHCRGRSHSTPMRGALLGRTWMTVSSVSTRFGTASPIMSRWSGESWNTITTTCSRSLDGYRPRPGIGSPDSAGSSRFYALVRTEGISSQTLHPQVQAACVGTAIGPPSDLRDRRRRPHGHPPPGPASARRLPIPLPIPLTSRRLVRHRPGAIFSEISSPWRLFSGFSVRGAAYHGWRDRTCVSAGDGGRRR